MTMPMPMKRRMFVPVLVAALAWTAVPAAAQNREHVQMAAELRILQEQTQQLALALAQISQALATLDASLDARVEGQVSKAVDELLGQVTDATRKSFADQNLLISDLAENLRIIRERTQENSARVGTLREEMEALRQAMEALRQATLTRPAAPPPFDPIDSLDPTLFPAPAADPLSSDIAVPETPAPVSSPDRMFRAAWADYTGGQYTLAIVGFEQFLRSFPRSERADEAQLLIGDSYHLMGRFLDAVGAYNQVIRNYPAGTQIALAYYKRGLAESQLGQTEAARASWEIVLDRHPTSEVAGLARQGLLRISDQTNR